MIRYTTERPNMNRLLLEGTPHMKRRYSQYAACPLPTPEERLLFLLMYLKQVPTQVAHGAAFGMGQPKANQWLHILLVALRHALHTLGDIPSRGQPTSSTA